MDSMPKIYVPRDIPGVKQKGYVQLCSVSHFKEYEDTDVKLFIVRSPGKMAATAEKYGLIITKQLSPSSQLFSKYYNHWKQEDFTEDEIEFMKTKGKTGTWWDLYTSEFIKEMGSRRDFRLAINRAMQLLDEGKNIMMVCFCSDVTRCHRGIIGYFLSQKGYRVMFD